MVFRLRKLAYPIGLALPAFPAALGFATIAYGLSAGTDDWSNRAPWGLGELAVGMLAAILVVVGLAGTRIQIDSKLVSKLSLYGAFRRSIPGDMLLVAEKTKGKLDFDSADDQSTPPLSIGWAFSIRRFWWPAEAPRVLMAIAAEARGWRAKHPDRRDWPLAEINSRFVGHLIYLALLAWAIFVLLAVFTGCVWLLWGAPGFVLEAITIVVIVSVLAALITLVEARRANTRTSDADFDPSSETGFLSFVGNTVYFAIVVGFVALIPSAYVVQRWGPMSVISGYSAIALVAVFVGALIAFLGRPARRPRFGISYRMIRSRSDRRQERSLKETVLRTGGKELRRPQGRALFYRWWEAALLFAVLAGGVVLLGLAVGGFSEASVLDAAGACKADAASMTGCYQLVRATVLYDDFHCADGIFLCSDSVTLQLGVNFPTVTVHGDGGQLGAGTVVTAKFYNGKITDVQAGGEDLMTDDNPAQRAGNLGIWGLILTFFGGMLCIPVVMWLQRRAGASSELGWSVVLGVAALFFLVVGIVSASISHVWTTLWPLNVIGGVLGYVPLAVWIAYAHRLPHSASVRWPARGLAIVLTVVIPLAVWAPVPSPPS